MKRTRAACVKSDRVTRSSAGVPKSSVSDNGDEICTGASEKKMPRTRKRAKAKGAGTAVNLSGKRTTRAHQFTDESSDVQDGNAACSLHMNTLAKGHDNSYVPEDDVEAAEVPPLVPDRITITNDNVEEGHDNDVVILPVCDESLSLSEEGDGTMVPDLPLAPASSSITNDNVEDHINDVVTLPLPVCDESLSLPEEGDVTLVLDPPLVPANSSITNDNVEGDHNKDEVTLPVCDESLSLLEKGGVTVVLDLPPVSASSSITNDNVEGDHNKDVVTLPVCDESLSLPEEGDATIVIDPPLVPASGSIDNDNVNNDVGTLPVCDESLPVMETLPAAVDKNMSPNNPGISNDEDCNKKIMTHQGYLENPSLVNQCQHDVSSTENEPPKDVTLTGNKNQKLNYPSFDEKSILDGAGTFSGEDGKDLELVDSSEQAVQENFDHCSDVVDLCIDDFDIVDELSSSDDNLDDADVTSEIERVSPASEVAGNVLYDQRPVELDNISSDGISVSSQKNETERCDNLHMSDRTDINNCTTSLAGHTEQTEFDKISDSSLKDLDQISDADQNELDNNNEDELEEVHSKDTKEITDAKHQEFEGTSCEDNQINKSTFNEPVDKGYEGKTTSDKMYGSGENQDESHKQNFEVAETSDKKSHPIEKLENYDENIRKSDTSMKSEQSEFDQISETSLIDLDQISDADQNEFEDISEDELEEVHIRDTPKITDAKHQNVERISREDNQIYKSTPNEPVDKTYEGKTASEKMCGSGENKDESPKQNFEEADTSHKLENSDENIGKSDISVKSDGLFCEDKKQQDNSEKLSIVLENKTKSDKHDKVIEQSDETLNEDLVEVDGFENLADAPGEDIANRSYNSTDVSIRLDIDNTNISNQEGVNRSHGSVEKLNKMEETSDKTHQTSDMLSSIKSDQVEAGLCGKINPHHNNTSDGQAVLLEAELLDNINPKLNKTAHSDLMINLSQLCDVDMNEISVNNQHKCVTQKNKIEDPIDLTDGIIEQNSEDILDNFSNISDSPMKKSEDLENLREVLLADPVLKETVIAESVEKTNSHKNIDRTSDNDLQLVKNVHKEYIEKTSGYKMKKLQVSDEYQSSSDIKGDCIKGTNLSTEKSKSDDKFIKVREDTIDLTSDSDENVCDGKLNVFIQKMGDSSEVYHNVINQDEAEAVECELISLKGSNINSVNKCVKSEENTVGDFVNVNTSNIIESNCNTDFGLPNIECVEMPSDMKIEDLPKLSSEKAENLSECGNRTSDHEIACCGKVEEMLMLIKSVDVLSDKIQSETVDNSCLEKQTSSFNDDQCREKDVQCQSDESYIKLNESTKEDLGEKLHAEAKNDLSAQTYHSVETATSEAGMSDSDLASFDMKARTQSDIPLKSVVSVADDSVNEKVDEGPCNVAAETEDIICLGEENAKGLNCDSLESGDKEELLKARSQSDTLLKSIVNVADDSLNEKVDEEPSYDIAEMEDIVCLGEKNVEGQNGASMETADKEGILKDGSRSDILIESIVNVADDSLNEKVDEEPSDVIAEMEDIICLGEKNVEGLNGASMETADKEGILKAGSQSDVLIKPGVNVTDDLVNGKIDEKQDATVAETNNIICLDEENTEDLCSASVVAEDVIFIEKAEGKPDENVERDKNIVINENGKIMNLSDTTHRETEDIICLGEENAEGVTSTSVEIKDAIFIENVEGRPDENVEKDKNFEINENNTDTVKTTNLSDSIHREKDDNCFSEEKVGSMTDQLSDISGVEGDTLHGDTGQKSIKKECSASILDEISETSITKLSNLEEHDKLSNISDLDDISESSITEVFQTEKSNDKTDTKASKNQQKSYTRQIEVTYTPNRRVKKREWYKPTQSANHQQWFHMQQPYSNTFQATRYHNYVQNQYQGTRNQHYPFSNHEKYWSAPTYHQPKVYNSSSSQPQYQDVLASFFGTLGVTPEEFEQRCVTGDEPENAPLADNEKAISDFRCDSSSASNHESDRSSLNKDECMSEDSTNCKNTTTIWQEYFKAKSQQLPECTTRGRRRENTFPEKISTNCAIEGILKSIGSDPATSKTVYDRLANLQQTDESERDSGDQRTGINNLESEIPQLYASLAELIKKRPSQFHNDFVQNFVNPISVTTADSSHRIGHGGRDRDKHMKKGDALFDDRAQHLGGYHSGKKDGEHYRYSDTLEQHQMARQTDRKFEGAVQSQDEYYSEFNSAADDSRYLQHGYSQERHYSPSHSVERQFPRRYRSRSRSFDRLSQQNNSRTQICERLSSGRHRSRSTSVDRFNSKPDLRKGPTPYRYRSRSGSRERFSRHGYHSPDNSSKSYSAYRYRSRSRSIDRYSRSPSRERFSQDLYNSRSATKNRFSAEQSCSRSHSLKRYSFDRHPSVSYSPEKLNEHKYSNSRDDRHFSMESSKRKVPISSDFSDDGWYPPVKRSYQRAHDGDSWSSFNKEHSYRNNYRQCDVYNDSTGASSTYTKIETEIHSTNKPFSQSQNTQSQWATHNPCYPQVPEGGNAPHQIPGSFGVQQMYGPSPASLAPHYSFQFPPFLQPSLKVRPPAYTAAGAAWSNSSQYSPHPCPSVPVHALSASASTSNMRPNLAQLKAPTETQYGNHSYGLNVNIEQKPVQQPELARRKVVMIGRNILQVIKQQIQNPAETSMKENFGIANADVRIIDSNECPFTIASLESASLANFFGNFPEIVIIMFGENDLDSIDFELEGFCKTLKRLILRLKTEFHVSRVVMCEILPLRVRCNLTAAELKSRTDEVNQRLMSTIPDDINHVYFWRYNLLRRNTPDQQPNTAATVAKIYISIKQLLVRNTCALNARDLRINSIKASV